MMIYGFTGMPWSGKSEAVKIANDKGIRVFRMGDLVWNEVKRRNLSLNPKNVGFVAQDMREKYGNTIWAEKTVEEIKKEDDAKIIVIDGIRSLNEVSFFRSHLSNSFHLVAIKASDKSRHQRAKLRKRIDDSIDDSEIQKRDERERKWGIEEVIENADISVFNESSLDDFRKKIVDLFSETFSE